MDEGSVNCLKIANNNHLICGGEDGCLRVFETKKMGDLFYEFPSLFFDSNFYFLSFFLERVLFKIVR